MMRIGIADRQILFHESVVALCAANDWKIEFRVCSYTELEKQMRKKEIDLLIMDIGQPYQEGMIVFKKILSGYPHIKLLVFGDDDNAVFVSDMYKSGVHCYMTKESGIAELKRAIEQVFVNGFHYLHDPAELFSSVKKTLAGQTVLRWFSPREIEIAKLARQELTNKEIAAKLGITVKAIEAHKTRMILKTNSKGTVGVLDYMVKNGVLEK